MPRDWQHERWVKLYIRDEPEWLVLPWQARGLFTEILKRVDPAGVLRLGKAGRKSIAAALSAPWDRQLRESIEALEEDGAIVFSGNGAVLCIPNFVEAQESKASDKARQAKLRAKRNAVDNVTPRDGGVTPRDAGVTQGNANVTRVTDGVTPGHEEREEREKRDEIEEIDSAAGAPANTLPGFEEPPKKRKPPRKATQLPDSWAPTEKHRELARTEGRDCEREATKFRDDAIAKGKVFKDWDAAFRNWLKSEFGRGKGPAVQTPSGRDWTDTAWKGPSRAEAK
jgi:hypothetical protein